MQSVTALEGAVEVVLTSPNGALPALLDIPIVKSGAEGVPPGTGPYRLVQGEEGEVLTARSDWWAGL